MLVSARGKIKRRYGGLKGDEGIQSHTAHLIHVGKEWLQRMEKRKKEQGDKKEKPYQIITGLLALWEPGEKLTRAVFCSPQQRFIWALLKNLKSLQQVLSPENGQYPSGKGREERERAEIEVLAGGSGESGRGLSIAEAQTAAPVPERPAVALPGLAAIHHHTKT
ncbi:uncharacterized [Tachysurus ichikawai]